MQQSKNFNIKKLLLVHTKFIQSFVRNQSSSLYWAVSSASSTHSDVLQWQS